MFEPIILINNICIICRWDNYNDYENCECSFVKGIKAGNKQINETDLILTNLPREAMIINKFIAKQLSHLKLKAISASFHFLKIKELNALKDCSIILLEI